jgi:predicted metalloprotease
MDRRDFIQGALTGIAATSCPICAETAYAAEEDEFILCGAKNKSFTKVTDFTRASRTGNDNLDKALISELRKQAKLFQLVPAFFVFTDHVKNAFATPYKFPDYPRSDGSILYGVDMMMDQLDTGYWGGAVVAGVLAHEYGHIYQYMSGMHKMLRKMHKTVKYVELHADFQSGYYIGQKYVDSGENVDVRAVASSTYDLGDTQYTNPQHHGTPVERTFALKAGFELHNKHRNMPIDKVAQEGVEFIQKFFLR